MFNSGLVRRNGMQDSQLDTIQQRLKQASDARAQEVAGSEVLYSGDANLTDEQIAKLPLRYIAAMSTTGKPHTPKHIQKREGYSAIKALAAVNNAIIQLMVYGAPSLNRG